MSSLMKSRRLAVFLLITSLLLSASAVVFINRYNVHESHHHGTLVLKGKDNLADATKSAYVQTYIGWLENFTSKDLEVTKEGKVTVVQILNVTPRSYSLMHKLNMIIENGVTVEITLDRSPNGVFFDAFQGNGKQIQDLDDLDALPDPPAPSTTSDAWDKAQQIAHTLNEGYWAAKYAAGYIDSHRKGGISSENGARDDVGGTGDRVLDGSTWQTINATHISKHWFEPDPTDPTGKRKIEVYREIFKLKDSDGIEPQVTRIKKPANPKNVTDPTGESLIFIGRVVSIGDPCWNLWSGEIENFQPVTYEVLSVVYGNYTVGESIIVNHAIIFGHPDADPTIPRLSSTIFTYGKELRVEAVYTGYNDTVTGVPIYETDFPTSPAAPVGGIWVLVGKLELLAPYIGLALVILVATVATAIYVKRVKRGREARID